ncbi:TPA: hypothetical protein DDW35_09025 [Candidatus Sumerlaeota bacterium]|jgi:hypothetical protein|nr:hypothetical protein [Candidatus Sumerlaeota bacterium]
MKPILFPSLVLITPYNTTINVEPPKRQELPAKAEGPNITLASLLEKRIRRKAKMLGKNKNMTFAQGPLLY